MSSVKLICLPYAGGSASLYQGWAKRLPAHIEVVAIDYPGHGRRVREPLLVSVEEMVQDIKPLIEPHIREGQRYALFGYSLGGLVAFETARSLKKEGYEEPCHLFMAAVDTPLRRREYPFQQQTDAEFMEYILSLGGTPPELFENIHLQEFYLPILKADFKAHGSYVCQDIDRYKLTCGIAVLYGVNDHTIQTFGKEDWEPTTDGRIQLFSYSGGHFFLHEHLHSVLTIIDSICLPDSRAISVNTDK